MKRNVGICTLFTGYNYGSVLQAFSLKNVINKLGYNGEIIKISGSIVKGRDFRIKKLLIIIFRSLLYSKNKKNVFKSYLYNNKGNFNKETIKGFDCFIDENLKPVFYSKKELKKKARNDFYYKFICGSDQIWNSTTYYVDPFYYLTFSPNYKKIAYAPSFGKDYIAKYNKKIITKYIKSFNYLSVREDSGVRIIKNIANIDVKQNLDPSLLTTGDEWDEIFKLNDIKIKNKYIFAYFLNEPSEIAKKELKKVSKEKGLKIITINNKIDDYECIFGGPNVFLKYLYNSSYVFTDSFHGVCFSINFNKQFFVYDRKYVAENQSTRITSLLNIFSLNSRYNYSKKDIEIISYTKVNKILKNEREKSIDWLKKSLEG